MIHVIYAEYVRFQKLWKTIKIAIHNLCRFKSILVPENNRQQNQEESYTIKYQRHMLEVKAIN